MLLIDQVLHGITNRNDFTSGIFRSVSGFQPRDIPEAAQRLIRFLHLDDKQSDYHVHACLCAVVAHPEIREQFSGTQTYDLSHFQRDKDSFKWVSPKAGRTGPFSIARVPTSFPVDFDIALKYHDLQKLSATVDGEEILMACDVIDGILYPDWAPETGIQGGLEMTASWLPGWTATVRHMPVAYPYRRVSELLDENTDKDSVFSSEDLQVSYWRTKAPSEKLALVLLGLSRIVLSDGGQ